jgi:hypothetical protein
LNRPNFNVNHPDFNLNQADLNAQSPSKNCKISRQCVQLGACGLQFRPGSKHQEQGGLNMRFPNTEAKIIALAQKMISGFTNNPNFPAPPISPASLQTRLDTAVASSDAQVMTQAAAKQATDTKQTDFDALIADMKTMLHYAEDTVQGDDGKLSELGWGGRAEPHALQVPGQPRLLEVLHQGAGWLTLDWKKPADGGAAASYRIERRDLTEGGAWTLAGLAIETEVTLSNQKRGKELEYRVIAVNKAGESEPSNTVTALL